MTREIANPAIWGSSEALEEWKSSRDMRQYLFSQKLCRKHKDQSAMWHPDQSGLQ